MRGLMRWDRRLCRIVTLAGCIGAGVLGVASARAQEASSFVAAGKTIRVDVYQPAAPGSHPSALILHGAGGMFFDSPEMRRVARQLAVSGVRAYLVHYFDGSGVAFTPSDQVLGSHYDEWLAVIRQAVDFVQAAQDVPTRPVAIYGYSMGAFLGIAASSNNPKVGALAEESGGVWANEMGRVGRMPPVLMIHGLSDRRVPFAKYAVPLEAILKRRGALRETLFVDHERHGFTPPAQARARQAVAAFILREIPVEKPSSVTGRPVRPRRDTTIQGVD